MSRRGDQALAVIVAWAGGRPRPRLRSSLMGAVREELLTIDQVEKGHWLAAQGMDDVPVIDDVAMLSTGMRPPAAQRRQRRRAEEAFEPVVVDPHAKPVADSARRHRIEHLLEDKPAGRGDGDDGLLVIRRPAP